MGQWLDPTLHTDCFTKRSLLHRLISDLLLVWHTTGAAMLCLIWCHYAGGVMMSCEQVSFDITTGMAGHLGAAVVSAHSAFLNIIGLTFVSARHVHACRGCRICLTAASITEPLLCNRLISSMVRPSSYVQMSGCLECKPSMTMCCLVYLPACIHNFSYRSHVLDVLSYRCHAPLL